VPLNEQRERGAGDQEHAECARCGRVCVGLTGEQLEDVDGQERPVFGQHRGHAEILQRLDEDQQAAGQDRRHHDRQQHGTDDIRLRTAEIAGGLLHRGVDGLKARQHRHHHVGIERQREHDHDAGHAVDRADRDADPAQGRGDDAGMAEQQDQSVGADERGKHQRQRRQRQQQRAARYINPGQAEGERDADRASEACCERRREQAVADGAEIITALHDRRVVSEGKGAGAVDPDARIEHERQRVKQENREQHQGHQGHDGGEALHGAGNAMIWAGS
jgi:hypothetical protein